MTDEDTEDDKGSERRPERARSAEAAATRNDAFDTGPGPSRAAFLIAYLGVVVAGLFGAAIGFGLVDASCRGDCTVPEAIGAIVGAVTAAVGVGVVAVLALRAMAEWRRPPGSSGPQL